MDRRLAVLSASMGAGHDAVAAELARRLTARGHTVETVDVLRLLPAGTGLALRAGYAAMVKRAPWAYALVHEAFLAGGGPVHGGTGPVVGPMASALRRRWAAAPPDAVVSVFHLAAQVGGRLRRDGVFPGPAAVFVTDFAVHRQWVHPGNDLHLCLTEEAAARVRHLGGAATAVVGPVVPPAFFPGAALGAARPVPAGGVPVLVSTGAWGVGAGLTGTARTLAAAGYTPLVLCGRDRHLRRRVARVPGAVALGWVGDMPRLLSGVRALVDNAAGQTAVQAMAAGVPVVVHRPIPGHGRDGAARMAAAGAAVTAPAAPALLAALGRLTADGPERAEQIRRARALFTADAAAVLAAHLPRRAHGQPNRRASAR